jgi:hypothetical protein
MTGQVNRIVATIRTGNARTQAMFEDLILQLEEAWKAVVVDVSDGKSPELGSILVLGGIEVAYEQGFFSPPAGADLKWLQENLPKFEAAAANGKKGFSKFLDELKARDEFKSAFAK